MFTPRSEAGPDPRQRATQFVADHILIRQHNNYDAYAQKTIDAWQAEVERLGPAKAPRGFWLRSDDQTYTEHGAHVNYLMPSGDGFGILGAIDVSNEGTIPEIQVWLTQDDGTGEPEVVSREAYSLTALDRAISLVEDQIR